MKLSPITVAVIATGAAAAALGAYALSRRGSSTKQANPQAAPQTRAREPSGGYAAQWEERREHALWVCRVDPEVKTFAQAVTCALNIAFPDAAPWTDPGVWSSWMEGAAELAAHDVSMAASQDDAVPRGWEFMLWLRAERELAACRSGSRFAGAVPLCAAQRMYPATDWSSAHRFPWQHDLLNALGDLARQGAA